MSLIGFQTAVAAAALAVFLGLGHITLRWLPEPRLREILFAALNLALVFALFFVPDWTTPAAIPAKDAMVLAGYVGLAVVHFLLLRWLAGREAASAWWLLALWVPVALLFALKGYTRLALPGFSYLSFRMTLAAMELRGRKAVLPGLAGYLGFLFFLPTFSLGPISPLSLHDSGLRDGGQAPDRLAIGAGRIAVGFVMYRLIAPFFHQLSFATMLTDGMGHGWLDYFLSANCSLAFLYLDFAGACHIAIGAAAVLGIPVKENFNNPILSRNLKDFWNRWHISLSELVRDLVFTPLNMALMRRLPQRYDIAGAVIASFATFTIIGLWHSFSFPMLLMGLAFGAGFSVVLLFEEFVRRKKLKKSRFLNSRAWHIFSVWLTLTFVAFTTIFFDIGKARDFR